jgi:hypothetical protein
VIEVFFRNFNSKRRIDKIEAGNHELMESLTSNFLSFKELQVIKHGHWYTLEVESNMKLWALDKLKEMGTTNGFDVRETEKCQCPCHRGIDLLEDPGCCKYYGRVRW